jgi:replicative DNA helicase
MKQELIKEAEAQVLAKIINEPKLYFLNAALIFEDLFSLPFHRAVFASFKAITAKSSEADLFSISSEIEQNFNGAFLTLSNILSNINYHSSIESLLAGLYEAYKERKIDKLLIQISQQRNSGVEVGEIIGSIQSELMKLTEVRHKEVKEFKHHLLEMFKNIDLNQKERGLTGFGTGFTRFDNFTGGLQRSDLVIVAGDTSQGKTSLALNIMRNTSVMFGNTVAIFSLEMSTLQLVTRIASQETGYDNKVLLKGKISENDYRSLNEKLTDLAKAKIYVDECGSSSLDYIINSIHGLKIQKGIDLVVIDYLQLVKNSKKGRSEESEIAEIARSFKNLAKELNICIVLLSQLSRGQNKREGGEPKLSDLRGSGQIEEAADTVVLVYRPEYYGVLENSDSDFVSATGGHSTAGIAELIIAKGRNIGIGKFYLKFEKELTKFDNIEQSFKKLEPLKAPF